MAIEHSAGNAGPATDESRSASAQMLTTTRTPFFATNGAQQNLFAVEQGVPLDDALNDVCMFIAASRGVIDLLSAQIQSDSAEVDDLAVDYAAWGAQRMLDLATAVTESCIGTANRQKT